MDVTKPYKFIGFGAIAITKPYKFIGFGAIAITKPKFGSRSMQFWEQFWSSLGQLLVSFAPQKLPRSTGFHALGVTKAAVDPTHGSEELRVGDRQRCFLRLRVSLDFPHTGAGFFEIITSRRGPAGVRGGDVSLVSIR